MALPGGWAQAENIADGTPEPDLYQAKLSNQSFTLKDGLKGSETLVIITNKRTGDFEVYEKNRDPDNLLYKNVTDPGSSGQQLEIENKERYNAFFTRERCSLCKAPIVGTNPIFFCFETC